MADRQDSSRLPDAARWAAVAVLGFVGTAGVLRAWVTAPPERLDPRPGGAPPAQIASSDAAPGDPAPAAWNPPAVDQPAPPPATGSVARRINVNTASAAELDLLPGIGPALAGRIIADREANGPYASLDDLDRVSGIGPKTVAKLAPYATIE